MKGLETRSKASISAKKRFEKKEERDANRDRAIKRWADGRYDGVRVGQCDWHELTLSSGEIIKLQGTWELKYARWMDANGVKFEAHRGRIPYVDDSGVARSYYPDFRLRNNVYVDVKNPFYETLHTRKLQLVQEQNDVCVQIINKKEMERLGLL